MRHRKLLFVLSGPSGVGKTSVAHELLKVRRGIVQAVSYTTRSIRNNEIDGIHYNFVSDERFCELYRNGDLVESTEVLNNKYGISKGSIQATLSSGKHCLLIVNWNGLIKLRKVFGDIVVGIFMSPPSIDALRDRIKSRKTETDESIDNRMIMAQEDMKYKSLYDHEVINCDMQNTVFELAKIIDMEV